jgi:benzoyl-CoA reductase/2-hydroxyglutaryl-CoA dehydratase subunit BcrC/BadD/HgdB
MEVLRGEISAVLMGESDYSSEDLNAALEQLRTKLKEEEKQYQKLREEDERKKISADNVIPAYEQMKNWAEEYDTCTMNQKKMIACQLFKRIEVSKDYSIHIEVNLTYKQFLENWTGAKFDLSA